MTFLTSIILGLCMGSGALFSMRFGEGNEKALFGRIRFRRKKSRRNRAYTYKTQARTL